MCGLAGFCDFKKQSERGTLLKMTSVLSHRGPNDNGCELIDTSHALVGLGHRRLSILDLSLKGHQPMHFRNIKLIFNGEIYNFKSLRKELKLKGYDFDSNSDTEVILKGYHCWGLSIVDKLIGMFAIAILDMENQELFLIRDRAGVKPLYYSWRNNLLLFSSELKSFHEHPRFEKNIDENSLSLFIQYSYIPAPYTIFKDTYKLEPGHILRISLKNQQFEKIKYWDAVEAYNKPKLNVSESDAIEMTENLMRSAYEYRMVADVPVGIFLSGGYDSSSVAAILQYNRTDKLKTFTIGYHESDYNEAIEAKKIANYLGTDHHEWYVTAEDAANVLNQLPEIYDEPFADNSTIPTILVSKFASNEVKVALSADGGDEIFAGYNKFNQSLKYTTSIAPWIQKILGSTMNIIRPEYIPYLNRGYNFETRYEKMKLIWSAADPVLAMKYISQYITESEANIYLKNHFTKYSTRFDAGAEVNHENDALNRMLAIDYQTFLSDNNLVKIDRATMSVSLEGREPMLDHRLLELVSSLPSNLKIKNGVNKYLLKKIVHKYIPKDLMERPKKPFIAPLTVWFKNSLKEQTIEYLNEDSLKKQGIFNHSEVIRYRDRYLRGEKVNYQKLWNILVFQLWYHRWMQ